MDAGQRLHRSPHEADLEQLQIPDFAGGGPLFGGPDTVAEAQASQPTLLKLTRQQTAEGIIMQLADDLQAALVFGEMLDASDRSTRLMLP